MGKIKLIFIGTGAIGGELLKSLSEDDRFEIMTVVTNRDKPAGRKMELQASPIKLIAEELGLPIFQPENINDPKSLETLRNLFADMMLLMAYGQILSREVLEITPHDCLNVHTSLLPKYRGASPVQNAILNQDNETGVCLMKMVEKMDAGPVYASFSISIQRDDNQKTLSEKLALLSAREIPSALADVFEGKLTAKEQNEDEAVYVKKITKERAAIDWNGDVYGIDAKIRAYYGWPGTFTFFRGKRLKIISAKAEQATTYTQPGTVTKDGIACKNGFIKPIELQLEGRNVQSLAGFINGNPDFIGSKL